MLSLIDWSDLFLSMELKNIGVVTVNVYVVHYRFDFIISRIISHKKHGCLQFINADVSISISIKIGERFLHI